MIFALFSFLWGMLMFGCYVYTGDGGWLIPGALSLALASVIALKADS